MKTKHKVLTARIPKQDWDEFMFWVQKQPDYRPQSGNKLLQYAVYCACRRLEVCNTKLKAGGTK
jgi:hypothetical protein